MRRRMLLGVDVGGGDTLVPPNNEIWFIASSDYYIQNPPSPMRNPINAKLVSKTYEDGLGKWVYDSDVIDLGGGDYEGMFAGNDGVWTVILPRSVQAWSSGTFSYTSVNTLVIQADLEAFPKSNYLPLNVYIRAVTPPSVSGTIAKSIKIYVPIESVDAYKSAAGWSTYAGQIYGYDFNNNDLWSDIQKK